MIRLRKEQIYCAKRREFDLGMKDPTSFIFRFFDGKKSEHELEKDARPPPLWNATQI